MSHEVSQRVQADALLMEPCSEHMAEIVEPEFGSIDFQSELPDMVIDSAIDRHVPFLRHRIQKYESIFTAGGRPLEYFNRRTVQRKRLILVSFREYPDFAGQTIIAQSYLFDFER